MDFKKLGRRLLPPALCLAQAWGAAGGAPAGFEVLAVIKAGRNPHQIAFSPDGRKAYVAAAASDWVAEIDVATKRLTGEHPAPGTPLGVAVSGDGSRILVSRFRAERVDRYRLPEFVEDGRIEVGPGASLFWGPLPDGRWLVSIERGDQMRVIDGQNMETIDVYPVGKRPFPPAATSDGKLAFVPAYDDGTVTVIDLTAKTVLGTVRVGERPSGGAVLPGDRELAVAVRGENRIVFVDVASRQVTGSLSEGVGDSPFSVVVSPDGRLAFVNNTASHDVSVVALPEKRVVARIPVGEIPIVMAVHPSGETLWVASEGSHEVTVVSIPESWRARQ